MKSIKYLLFTCAMLFFATRGNAQDLQYTITGKLDNFSVVPSKIYLVEPVHTGVLAKSLDSSDVKNGEYHFSGQLLADQATQVQITTTKTKITDQNQVFALVVDKGDFRVVSDGSLTHSTITGTGALAQHEFEEMMAPAKALADSINAEKKAGDYEKDKAVQQRIQARSAKALGLVLFTMYNYAKKQPEARITPYTTFLLVSMPWLQQPGKDTLIANMPKNKLNDPLQKLTIATDKRNRFVRDSLTQAEYSKLDIGKKALDFTQKDPSGKPVTLSSFKGKYVLVDFWASWCTPCRAENPNVVNAYQKYKEKGFTVLGVSLDAAGSKAAWLKAIAQDHLTWTQVSDLTGWKNSAALLYDVRAVPQNFLIDPNGVIIGKNLRGEALNEKLVELFK